MEESTPVDYSQKAEGIMQMLIGTSREFTQYEFFTLALGSGIPRERLSLLCRLVFYRFEKRGQIIGTKKERLCGKARKSFQVWEVPHRSKETLL
jgi:hypothetical protein